MTMYSIYIISRYENNFSKIGIERIGLYDKNNTEISILYSNVNINIDKNEEENINNENIIDISEETKNNINSEQIIDNPIINNKKGNYSCKFKQ